MVCEKAYAWTVLTAFVGDYELEIIALVSLVGDLQIFLVLRCFVFYGDEVPTNNLHFLTLSAVSCFGN